MESNLSIEVDRKYFDLLSRGKINFGIVIKNPDFKVGVKLDLFETVKGANTGRYLYSVVITHILDASRYGLQAHTAILTLKVNF